MHCVVTVIPLLFRGNSYLHFILKLKIFNWLFVDSNARNIIFLLLNQTTFLLRSSRQRKGQCILDLEDLSINRKYAS